MPSSRRDISSAHACIALESLATPQNCPQEIHVVWRRALPAVYLRPHHVPGTCIIAVVIAYCEIASHNIYNIIMIVQ